jgi:hypothetical protein
VAANRSKQSPQRGGKIKSGFTGNLRFVENTKKLLADDLAELENAFTGLRDAAPAPIALPPIPKPLPAAPEESPVVIDASTQTVERVISVEANSGMVLPDTDSTS